MPVGFSSPARNLFLLGSTGAQVVSNFFESISKASTTDGVFIPDEIRYIDSNQKYALAGSAQDSNSKGFGWFERQDYNLETGSLTTDYSNRIESTLPNTSLTLRAMELDSNENLIVVGFSGTVPWIAKYSNDGVLDWQSTSNSANVRYLGVTSDSNNNYYACGRTSYALSDTQAFVEKFDSNGNPGWGKSAFMLGRDVVLAKISANDRGEVVAVGFLEDDSAQKGYIVKIDTNTGEVLWDRTLERSISGYGGFVLPSSGDGITPADVKCTACYIDSNDQIYVVGSIDGKGTNDNGVGEFLIKYSPEGNIIWQRERDTRDFINNPSGAPNTVPFDVKSDGETEQTVVLSVDSFATVASIELSKYSKSGDLVFRRRINKSGDQLGAASLDADPSFYYFIFRDQEVDGLAGEPDRYTFGKVSTSGNGLGNFQYDDGTATIVDYNVANGTENKIGRMSDGSITNSVSDLMTYPFTANQVVFDDLATHVSNKKRQMDDADSFEYSGSPAIRIFDFQQELNLLGDTGITEPVDNTPTIGTIVYGTDNADNSFDSTNDGSLVLDTTGYTFNTWSGSQLMSDLGGFGANSAQVWRTTNFDSVLWTISTDSTKRYIYTSDDGINWIQSTDLYDTDVAPVNVTSKWLATSAGANVSTITVSGVAGGTNYTNRWDATVNYNHGGNYAFDGSTSTRVEPKDNQTVTWTAGTAIPVGSTLEFNIVRAGTIGASDFQVNGTNYGGSVPNSQGWITIPESSLSSFSLFHNSGTSSVEVFAVRIDGSILTDGDDVPTGSTPGAWVDQSGKGNDGVVNGATHNAAGYWEFDGTDDNIFVDDPQQKLQFVDTGSDFAIECWAKRTAAGSGSFETMLSAWGQASGIDGWIIAHDAGSLHFTWAPHSQATTFMTGGTLNLNTWYHIMVTKNGSAFTMYLDGVSVATGTNAGTINTSYDKLEIGHYGANDASWFTGHIGEVRIYPRALTAAAVFQNYNATKSKYINEAPDTAPKIGPGISYNGLALNYDFGNRATYDPAENIVPNSQDKTGWNSVRGSITEVDITVPDGSRGAFLYTESTETGAHHFKIPYNVGGSDYGDEITWSSQLYFKRYGSKNKIRFGLNTKSDTYRHILFDFNTGQVENEFSITGTYSVDDVGGGWYRLNLTDNGDTGATRNHAVMSCFMVQNDTTSTSSYTGDGESGVYFWGPNLKIGGVSRYVKTYGSAITAPTTVKNLSSSSYTGTLNGPTFNTDGSFQFDGTDDYIVVSNFSGFPGGNSPFTVSLWLNTDHGGTAADEHVFFYGSEATGEAIRIRLFANGGIEVGHWGGPGYDWGTSAGAYNLNEWTMITETYDGTTDRIYVNGTEVDNDSSLNNLNIPTQQALYIGRRVSDRYYSGKVGELRVYDRELTATEVSQNFNATRSKYGV